MFKASKINPTTTTQSRIPHPRPPTTTLSTASSEFTVSSEFSSSSYSISSSMVFSSPTMTFIPTPEISMSIRYRPKSHLPFLPKWNRRTKILATPLFPSTTSTETFIVSTPVQHVTESKLIPVTEKPFKEREIKLAGGKTFFF